MESRLLGSFRAFRGKKKKSPEAAPAQQHENPEQFQPLEDDATLDRTEEKKPSRGRFHKTLKTFWKSPRIRRSKTGSAAAEGPAEPEPESGLTELQAEPDVSPDSSERSENSHTSVTETCTKALLTSMTEDVAITNTDNEETEGITNTDTSPDPAEPSEDSEAAMNDQRAKADMAVTEDVDITNTNNEETQAITNTDTSPDPAEPSENSEAAMNDQRAKALLTSMTDDVDITNTNIEETQGITNTDTSTDPAEPSEDSEAAMNDQRAKADMGVTEDVDITNTNNEGTQGITNTDTSTDPAEPSEDSEAAMNDQRAKADMAVTEDVDITNAKTRHTQGIANTDTMPSPTLSQELIFDFFKDPCVSSQSQQVPAKVKNIHQSLMSQVTVDAWLQIDILRLAEEHPADMVLTLLRCAPTCDRAAAMMWRTIGSSSPTVEKVLPTLLCVMENWPLHSMCTSDGDNEDVFALAATLVLWVILQVPECQEAMNLYSSRLFVALLFHVVITTQQIPPEEAATFWRACWEEHRLHSKPNRFAVQAMKALLCRLQWDHVVVAMERKRGWDTLLCADTQHYAVGLLARELRHVSVPFCSYIAFRLLRPHSREEPCWDLPFLAFLVEVLGGLDLSECGGSILEMMSRYLRSECRERRRLALRGLVVLAKDPVMARRMYPLSQGLLELLGDAHGEVVSMSLSVFMNVLQNKNILVSSTTAPKLAEALLPLFDHDSSHVQLLSIQLFEKVMDLVVDEAKKPLKRIVNQSQIPLFLHCHEDNQRVANVRFCVIKHCFVLLGS
ncbi:maestro heat-like repeat family member 5 [Taeniopygia guttata]|uniref:maestro heat-like repeat family member 5 n=1 Tax=Taeniopygia guttata TaxID=59729 RepID=UPI003BB86C46